MILENIFQLILSGILGAIIGIEREATGKEAGVRTLALVSIASCLFTILSVENSSSEGDPLRIIAGIATGVGFLGAGVIIFRRDHIEGLTTAATLWLVAALGCAVGFSWYFLAFFATILAFFILYFLRKVPLEEKAKKILR